MSGKISAGLACIPIKPLDIPLIFLAILVIVVMGRSAYSAGNSDARVIVRGPDKTWVYPLNAGETLSVTGSIGETVVEISRGRAAIISSPCEGQTCVAAGDQYKNGQWAACLPNRVFILIEGDTQRDTVDAASW